MYFHTDQNGLAQRLVLNQRQTATQKCGFPLAEEQKKRKMFFSHTAGSLGTGVQRGFRSRGLLCRFQFLFCDPSLPDMPHPPIRGVLVECVKLR